MPPDIYRHIARKSTVSRNSKSQPKNAAPYPLPHMCKEEPSVFEAIQCDIKEEKNVPPVEQSLVLLPDNEMEQATEETLREMIEQIQLRVQDEWLQQVRTVVHGKASLFMLTLHGRLIVPRRAKRMAHRRFTTRWIHS